MDKYEGWKIKPGDFVQSYDENGNPTYIFKAEECVAIKLSGGGCVWGQIEIDILLRKGKANGFKVLTPEEVAAYKASRGENP